MKTRFILNPCSGRNRRRLWLPTAIRDFIAAQALSADLVSTEAPGHATALAAEAVQAGCEQVVAVGGDGTMNEVAQALLHTPTALALVPCGSGNGLALHLGLPLALAEALALIAAPTARVAAIDTGEVNGHPFFNAMGLGLDAEVSQRFNSLTHRGLPAYARTAWCALRAIKSERVAITCNRSREECETLLLAVANSDQYGNNARIAPGARVDDGELDLVAVAPVGMCGALALSARLFSRSFDRSSYVRRWRSDQFQIDRVSPGLIHTDGETHLEAASLTIRVRPRSLHVLVPASAPVTVRNADWSPAGFALQLP